MYDKIIPYFYVMLRLKKRLGLDSGNVSTRNYYWVSLCKLRKMHFITCLNRASQSDLFWWHAFLLTWNGHSILRHPLSYRTPIIMPKLMLQDPAAVLGYSGSGRLNSTRLESWLRSWCQLYLHALYGDHVYLGSTSTSNVTMPTWSSQLIKVQAKTSLSCICFAPFPFS